MEEDDFSKYSPWVLRIKLNFQRKLDKGIPMEQICASIMEEFEGNLKCWHSDDNAESLLILVRIVKGGDKNEYDGSEGGIAEDQFLKKIEHMLLNDITLCGISGISRVFISETKYSTIDEHGVIKGIRVVYTFQFIIF